MGKKDKTPRRRVIGTYLADAASSHPQGVHSSNKQSPSCQNRSRSFFASLRFGLGKNKCPRCGGD